MNAKVKNSEVTKVEKLTAKQLAKETRDLKAQARKEITQARKEKNEVKKDVVFSWLNDTRSKSAIKKYCLDNGLKVLPFINKINDLYGTNFDLGVVNGTLENFALTTEENYIDVNGRILEGKSDFRTIKYYLDLLERKAKFGDYNSKEFKAYNVARLNATKESMLKSEVKKVLTATKLTLNKAEYLRFSKACHSMDTKGLSNSAYLSALKSLAVQSKGAKK